MCIANFILRGIEMIAKEPNNYSSYGCYHHFFIQQIFIINLAAAGLIKLPGTLLVPASVPMRGGKKLIQ